MNKVRSRDIKIAASDFRRKRAKLSAKLFTRYPFLVKLWARHSTLLEFSESPWAEMSKPIPACRLALVTTSGVHLHSQTPFNMKDSTGDATFREIPAETSRENLTITHDYYDHSDADKDINIVFPLERVLDLKKLAEIGDVNYRHFSFMGHITNHHVHTLMRDTAPQVASALKADGVDIVILTPA